ncbi:MAG: SIS domain-containing protein [Chloroflexota bacterium]
MKKRVSHDPVDDYLKRLAETLERISRQQVWQVIDALFQAWQAGRRIYILGNGGSAATASHMANDLNKYTIVEGLPRMKAQALTDNVPLMTAWGNDTAYENIFSQQLINFLEPGDVVIAISASGNSPNVLRALEVARQGQAVTIGLTGDDGGKLKHLVDHCVCIPDELIGRQEDGHMILDHLIANTLHQLILAEKEKSA